MNKIIEYALRAALVGAALQWVDIQVMDMALVRQKRIWGVYLFMVGKTFLLALCSNMLTVMQPADEFWSFGYKMLDFIIGMMVFMIFIWLWEDEPLHILMISLTAEGITMCLTAVTALINGLEGRENLFEVIGPFLLPDLLIPVIVLLIFRLSIPYLQRVMHFLGQIRLRHRKLLWFVFAFVFTAAHSSALFYNNAGEYATTAIIVQSCMMIAMTVVLLGQFIASRYRLQGEEEHFLDMQIDLLRKRSVIMRHAKKEMLRARILIEEQMNELESRIERGETVCQDDWGNYVQELQEAMNIPYRGRYCRDVLVDEALSFIADSARERGSHISINIRSYDRGKIEEEDMVRLLFCLMSRPDEHHKEADLTIAGTESHLVMIAAGENLRKPGRRISVMQEIAGKYRGEVSWRHKGKWREASVVLGRE